MIYINICVHSTSRGHVSVPPCLIAWSIQRAPQAAPLENSSTRLRGQSLLPWHTRHGTSTWWFNPWNFSWYNDEYDLIRSKLWYCNCALPFSNATLESWKSFELKDFENPPVSVFFRPFFTEPFAHLLQTSSFSCLPDVPCISGGSSDSVVTSCSEVGRRHAKKPAAFFLS